MRRQCSDEAGSGVIACRCFHFVRGLIWAGLIPCRQSTKAVVVEDFGASVRGREQHPEDGPRMGEYMQGTCRTARVNN